MKKVLVIRNDKLGDFMLAWPAFAMLKASDPSLKLTALVPTYTAEIARACPYLDEVIVDVPKRDKAAFQRLMNDIKAQRFDAMISFFSNTHNAKLAWKCRIPYRLAPATKWVQFFYNHRLVQRRSQSAKPEFAYNLDLARRFLQDQSIAVVEPRPPYLSFPKSAVDFQREFLCGQLNVDSSKKWIFVHSGSGGSANNLSLAQYAALIQGLLAQFDAYVILTAGPNESEKAHELAGLVQDARVAVYDKNNGLVDFAHSLACADLFIAGSTGPLHLSGALNVPTIGFYPSRRSATPLRWQPLNDKDKHLAFCPSNDKASQTDLSKIPVEEKLAEMIRFITKVWHAADK
ncbi:glycosyltransferase family 9 protein [Aggregatibacter actinomycetemcomitans]|uniref:glycosyltransferase family 9 protein n=1 Tax=Aggregatibacter actinomycetemcomitans TaxID=714 RepID=UPI0011D7EB50|nr:glycosyltransferase family 9 protein [Aggregatibacter actinomycetemcomitans]QEH44511.1 glycosyltransferase family 9 protein [Aggregatibacter actinomycetemcomitans]QEH46868.1 glycosyltransferase family 9 protein [Aggregatibacter actinomycetemcomitans]QEH48583.1 glycosyltransferase family 9 protein [Aggregatibacter actinomycetemcomitans]TYA49055.1 glycosyltransferase family 9 protein [Aggregatibacter actinomycetemcomitans]TYA51886.1 glycosyltransferase family 9 protein [Aggregatibacter actino